MVQAPSSFPMGEREREEVGEGLRLSWIVMDPIGRRAMNLSSRTAVSVQRHYLTGDLQVRFGSVLAGDEGSASEMVMCSVEVTCVGDERGERMHVREACLQMEDVDGMHLNGEESLGILQRALEGKRESKKGLGLGLEKCGEFERRKRERKEMMVRREWAMDVLCVTLAAMSFLGFVCVFVLRRL